MKYFVLINGKNFLLNTGDGIKKHGFYKWVVVDSKNPKEAEIKAVEKLRKDKLLIAQTKNKKNNPPLLFLEDIQEIDDKEKIKDTGFCFYSKSK